MKQVSATMYTPDYGNMQFLLEDRLREAERQREHKRLVREALAFSHREDRASILSQIKRLIPVRVQHQETSDVRRATAV